MKNKKDKKDLKRTLVIFSLSVIALSSGYLLVTDAFHEGKKVIEEGILPAAKEQLDKGEKAANLVIDAGMQTPTLPEDEAATMATENFQNITLSRIEPKAIETPSGDAYGQIILHLKFPEVRKELDGTSTHYITMRQVQLSGLKYDAETVELVALSIPYHEDDSVMFEYEDGEDKTSEEVYGYILYKGITVQEYLLKKANDPMSPLYGTITLKNNFDGKYADRLNEIVNSKKESVPVTTEAGTSEASEITEVTTETTVAETMTVDVEETTEVITESVPAEESS